MKPAAFTHHVPRTIDDAVGLLAEYGDDAKPIAGGQSLVPLLALRMSRFEHLIDINNVDGLTGITEGGGGDGVIVGAMTRQRTAERDPTIATAVPLLARALPWIGHFQIRNRGTIGGSVAHGDPASELPAVTLALDAELVVAGRSGERSIPAADFFLGHFTTAIGDGELLRAIRFPSRVSGDGFAIREFARRHGDFAVAGVAVAVRAAGDRIDRAAISFFGMGSTPMRSPSAEADLIGRQRDALDHAAIDEIAAGAVAGTDPSDDIHASAAHRRHIARHLAVSAIDDALNEAFGGAA